MDDVVLDAERLVGPGGVARGQVVGLALAPFRRERFCDLAAPFRGQRGNGEGGRAHQDLGVAPNGEDHVRPQRALRIERGPRLAAEERGEGKAIGRVDEPASLGGVQQKRLLSPDRRQQVAGRREGCGAVEPPPLGGGLPEQRHAHDVVELAGGGRLVHERLGLRAHQGPCTSMPTDAARAARRACLSLQSP